MTRGESWMHALWNCHASFLQKCKTHPCALASASSRDEGRCDRASNIEAAKKAQKLQRKAPPSRHRSYRSPRFHPKNCCFAAYGQQPFRESADGSKSGGSGCMIPGKAAKQLTTELLSPEAQESRRLRPQHRAPQR